ncbi:MAG: TolC family protein [Dissulfurimicrobium sp.]|uniref:TolC family protein n=1 Tax=Dissulfurimicrobium sp. TaxID=2022436 RepID=UPI00404B4D7A
MRASIGVFLIICCIVAPSIVPIVFAANGQVLSLNECLSIALEQSPLIKGARFDVEASKEAVKEARGQMFPRVDLNAAYFKENQAVPYIPAQSTTIPAKFSDEIYSWGVFLRVPIYEGGRLAGQLKASELEEAVQSAKKDFTTQDLIANVTNTFNKLLQLKELQKAYSRSVAALEEQKKNTEFLLKTGRAPKVELLRIEVQLASERQNLVKAVESTVRTKNALAFLLGVNEDQIMDVNGALTADEHVEVSDIDSLIDARPDVVAALKRVEEAKTAVAIASGKRYPSLAAVSSYGDRAGTGFNQREEVWEAGLVASVNIFDAGVISSEINRQKAIYEKAKEQMRLVRLQARREVADALSLINDAKARLDLAQKAVSQSEESLRIEKLKYKTGAGTITDVLLSEAAMSLSNANYYQALYDYNSAVTEFKRATGTIGVKR